MMSYAYKETGAASSIVYNAVFVYIHSHSGKYCSSEIAVSDWYIEGRAQDYSNSNIFLKSLFRGNLDPFVNNANLGAIAHMSNGT